MRSGQGLFAFDHARVPPARWASTIGESVRKRLARAGDAQASSSAKVDAGPAEASVRVRRSPVATWAWPANRSGGCKLDREEGALRGVGFAYTREMWGVAYGW